MRFLTRQAVSALILSASLISTAVAHDSGLVLSNGKGASVNGQQVSGKKALLAGDDVRTSSEPVLLTVPSGSVSVSEQADVVFQGDSLKVNSGAARFTTDHTMGAVYRSLTIRPAGKKKANYFVGTLNGRPTIAALQGSLVISDGQSSMVLAEGRAITPQQPAPAIQGGGATVDTDNTRDSKNDARRGGAKGGGAFSGMPGWVEAAILIGAVGGTLGGLGLAGAFSQMNP